MAVVNFTTQEFTSRSDQAFDLADKGEKVIIRRGRRRAYRLMDRYFDSLWSRHDEISTYPANFPGPGGAL